MCNSHRHLYRGLIDSPGKTRHKVRSQHLFVRGDPRRPPRSTRHQSHGEEINGTTAVLDGKGDNEEASGSETRELEAVAVAEQVEGGAQVDNHLLPEYGLEGDAVTELSILMLRQGT